MQELFQVGGRLGDKKQIVYNIRKLGFVIQDITCNTKCIGGIDMAKLRNETGEITKRYMTDCQAIHCCYQFKVVSDSWKIKMYSGDMTLSRPGGVFLFPPSGCYQIATIAAENNK